MGPAGPPELGSPRLPVHTRRRRRAHRLLCGPPSLTSSAAAGNELKESSMHTAQPSEALAAPILRHDELQSRVRTTLARLSQTGALPTLPAAASAALALARDPDADVDKLCRVIQTD